MPAVVKNNISLLITIATLLIGFGAVYGRMDAGFKNFEKVLDRHETQLLDHEKRISTEEGKGSK